MPTLVQFGAGNIGRGFIGPVFSAAGWRVRFVDVDPTMLAALAADGAYTVYEVTNQERCPRRVSPVDGINGRDREAVAEAVASADLIATAVGLGALPHIASGLAQGLQQRHDNNGKAVDILVCENGIQAPDLLRQAVAAQLVDSTWLHSFCGFVRTSIGRMVPPAGGGHGLDIAVEPYATLPVERGAFRGPIPEVAGLVAKDDFDLVLRQKLYLHNGTHACFAYAGLRRGLATIPDCMEDPGLVAAVRAAGEEISMGLARAHGHTPAAQQVVMAECQHLLNDLFQRYGNRPLGDPLRRVARDPVRKLAADDRLIGAAHLCLQQGLQPIALAHRILDACAYDIANDEPQAEAWRQHARSGWRALLAEYAALTPEDPLMNTLALAERQRAAAERIRNAGLHLKDHEIAEIEIADFGLNRFDQLGLAIVVYVNTERCCAKELAMVPGQICPEHRHPSVDGEMGKEETFRCRAGEVHLFLPGHKKDSGEREFALALLPDDKRDTVTVFKHVHLLPGDQYTLKPNTPHWFVAGPEGAVISEFSTRSRDEADVFTDTAIQRVPV